MIALDITVDWRPCVRTLNDDAERQIPFALSRAINSTVLDVQRAERNRLQSIFTLRRQEWAFRSIKIVHFATKRAPWATIGIHPPGNEGRKDILGKFETDTVKLPRGRELAVPVNAKRTGAGIITKGQRPRNIIASGKAFIIPSKRAGLRLIVRRTGKKLRDALQTLYFLVHRVRINPNLQFIPTAIRVVDTRFSGHMVREFDNAMKTAR